MKAVVVGDSTVMLRVVVVSFALLTAGCTASVATLFIPRELHSQGELDRAPMGWPLKFVHQDLSGYTPMSWPQSFQFGSPQEHPVFIDLGLFAANVLVFAGVLTLIFRLGLTAGRRCKPTAE